MKQRNRFKTHLAATVAVLLAASSLEATTYRYVTETGSGTKSGENWDNASDNLQDMIDELGELDQVWVAAGTYVPTSSDGFTLKNRVKVYGGFAGYENPATFDPETGYRDFVNNKSTLDGQNSKAKVVYATNVDYRTILDGFTITGATSHAIDNKIDASPTFRNLIVEDNTGSYGAGMHNVARCSPQLTDCTFRNNTSSGSGGAVNNDDNSNAFFTNCLFDNNTASGSGGAILDDYNSHSSCTDCEFTGNTAGGNGGALYHTAFNNANFSLSLRNCTFELNQANQGGAVNLEGQTGKTIEIAHCSFDHNVAGPNNGGAINIGNSSTSVQIASCTFESCTANQSNGSGMGGAINTRGILSVVNSIFDGNQALLEGGAIYCVGGSNTTIVNCTFAGNTADDAAGLGGGGLFASSSADTTIQNSIFWDNTANGASGEAAQLILGDTYTLSHTCIQNPSPHSSLTGTNLISDDPLFVGGSGDDALHLNADSPCIDAGLLMAVPADTMDVDDDADLTEKTPDALLQLRVQDLYGVGGCNMAVDLGAIEKTSDFDCDGDGTPDVEEIVAGTATDANGDGIDDACQDCDGDSVLDPIQIANCTTDPECQDCNLNCIPDGCEADCNENGVPDDCDVAYGTHPDCNGNGIPDECDINTEDPDEDGIISEDCNNNSIPDECDVVPCPLEIVFILDKSGSSGGGNALLFCTYVVSPLMDALNEKGILTHASYLSILPPTASCGDAELWRFTDTSVSAMFLDPTTGTVPVPGDGSCGPLNHEESWGAATAVVADGWDWQPVSDGRRIIITFSDEGPCEGGSCDPDDPTDSDRQAVENAIDVANANDVTVYCVGGDDPGTYDCVSTLGQMLADGTGGLEFHINDPDIDDYADIGENLIAAILPCNDCNTNGVMDDCECIRGNMTDADAPDLVNGYDIQDFVTCLINGDPSPYGCYCADMNDDHALNMEDVPCFVELLLTGTTDCTVNPCLWEEGEGESMMAVLDCNENGRTDSHDLILGISEDANGNGIPDECDISAATSADINTNGVPDESEPDLNGNGVPDDVDIAAATSADVNSNGIPDEAEDCNGNGYPDEWEIAQSITADCNNNGTPDDCDDDCNANGVPDDCEIDPTDPDGDGLVSPDCNGNGFPDACDFDWLLMFSLDCNENGIPDECDVASGTSQDCNNNGFPDGCDIAAGISTDANTNGIPDECESLAAQSYASPLTEGSADETEAWIEFYTWHWSQQWGSASPLTGAEQFRLMVNKLQELGLPVDASSL